MKKIISCILAVILFATILSACNTAKTNDANNDKIKIITTIFPQYDFARQIAKDNADIKMLISPAQESHGYEPTPQDIIEVGECDLFIYTGGESDNWVEDILSSIDNEIKCIKLMDCVELKETDHDAEHNHDEHKAEFDEHVWTSPINAGLICEEIAQTLCEIDAENALQYNTNLESYLSQLNLLDTTFKEIVANGNRNTLIFGDRFPLIYFTEEYGLKCYAAFPGCAEQTEPSSATIADLIDKANEEKIPVIFKIELSNDNIAKTIADASNAQVMTFYTCHNLTQEDFDNGETYVSLMNKNADSLKIALN